MSLFAECAFISSAFLTIFISFYMSETSPQILSGSTKAWRTVFTVTSQKCMWTLWWKFYLKGGVMILSAAWHETGGGNGSAIWEKKRPFHQDATRSVSWDWLRLPVTLHRTSAIDNEWHVSLQHKYTQTRLSLCDPRTCFSSFKSIASKDFTTGGIFLGISHHCVTAVWWIRVFFRSGAGNRQVVCWWTATNTSATEPSLGLWSD